MTGFPNITADWRIWNLTARFRIQKQWNIMKNLNHLMLIAAVATLGVSLSAQTCNSSAPEGAS
jgi:hypothetical protein